MKDANSMTNLEILAEVLESEKRDGCANRVRLDALNGVMFARTGKTIAKWLDELGM